MGKKYVAYVVNLLAFRVSRAKTFYVDLYPDPALKSQCRSSKDLQGSIYWTPPPGKHHLGETYEKEKRKRGKMLKKKKERGKMGS
jgi:hypothetical protein